ncbi:MAG: phosphoribosylanthranilate isomerase [Planctomycetota bacterium]|jgi:phosphoribosylanthranilate isomerase
MSDARIKVCGITTIEDALACHGLGADLLGLIFTKSPRKITPERAMEIRTAVPEARLVGVFMDEEMETVIRIASEAGLNLIQLHGHEPPAYCEELMELTGLPVIRALRYEEASNPQLLDAFTVVPLFLFDLDKNGSNGNGKASDNGREAMEKLWDLAAEVGAQGIDFLLAGGLDAENVKDALAATRPFGVDVCRGVESEPGLKDIEKVKQFIAEVKSCKFMDN